LPLDPDLDSESRSGSRHPIESGSNPDPDPDPQPCLVANEWRLVHSVLLSIIDARHNNFNLADFSLQ
jgi:hypothetical protein